MLIFSFLPMLVKVPAFGFCLFSLFSSKIIFNFVSEYLIGPVKQKFVRRLSTGTQMLKQELISLDDGGILILLYDVYILVRWLIFFLPSFLAGEYYIGHIVSSVIPFIGQFIWNIFLILPFLALKLGVENPTFWSCVTSFVDYYHYFLLTLNSVLEIVLLCVLALAKTWMWVRSFLYTFLIIYYNDVVNPHTNFILRMTYERVELWVDDLQWPMLACEDKNGLFTKETKGWKLKIGQRYYMWVKSGKEIFSLDSKWPIPVDIIKDGRKWHGIVRGRLNNRVLEIFRNSFLELIIVQIFNGIIFVIDSGGLFGSCQ